MDINVATYVDEYVVLESVIVEKSQYHSSGYKAVEGVLFSC